MTPLIYALSDPRTGEVRYIGYTRNFAYRIHAHYRDKKYSSGRKLQCLAQPWLYELAEEGLLPISKILERLDIEADWQEREKFWIDHYKSLGARLLNGTDGGFGSKGGWYLSDEAKKRISAANKQAWLNKTPEQKDAALDVLAEGRKLRTSEDQSVSSKIRWSRSGELERHNITMKEYWAKWRAERGYEGTWDERRKKRQT